MGKTAVVEKQGNALEVIDWESLDLDMGRPAIFVKAGEDTESSHLDCLREEHYEASLLVLEPVLNESGQWQSGEHVLIKGHLSPRTLEYSHENCFVFQLCAGCDSDLLLSIAADGAGTIAVYIDGTPDEYAASRFVIDCQPKTYELIGQAFGLLEEE